MLAGGEIAGATLAQRVDPRRARLDDLPFPLHDDLPEYAGYGFATIESSRGCYHACTFCLPCAFYRAAGAPYRLRSIINLVDEIEALHQRGTRLFLFDDEQFLPPGRAREERVEALGHELERRNLQIAFTIKCRADDVDALLFRRLKAMGLLRVYVGVESGCQATLDLLGKRVTAQRNAEALTTLDELDIVADFRSLLFHPWSTLETVQADIAFLQSVMPHLSTSFQLPRSRDLPRHAVGRSVAGGRERHRRSVAARLHHRRSARRAFAAADAHRLFRRSREIPRTGHPNLVRSLVAAPLSTRAV